MQYILREKLLAQASKLADVSNLYGTESHRFVSAYLGWLVETEKDLSRLGSPLNLLLQAEKSTVSAVLDGYLPGNIQTGKSLRKSQRAVAAQSLEKVSRELYAKIESLTQSLDELNEKLCHAIAILGSKEPGIYQRISASQEGVATIWKMLGSTPETFPMYNYFCAKLATTDRNYLLMDIILKIMVNKGDMVDVRGEKQGTAGEVVDASPQALDVRIKGDENHVR